MMIGRENCIAGPGWHYGFQTVCRERDCSILHEFSSLRIVVASKELATLMLYILGILVSEVIN